MLILTNWLHQFSKEEYSSCIYASLFFHPNQYITFERIKEQLLSLMPTKSEAAEDLPIIQVTLPLLDPPSDIVPIPPHVLSPDQQEKLDAFREHLPNGIITEDKESAYYAKEVEWCDDPCLLRYLRATKWDLEQAKTKLAKTLVWRREFKPDEIPPSEIAFENETGKFTINGFDRHGSPLAILRPQHENTKPGEHQIRNVVFNLERAFRLMPPGAENVTIIVDFTGAGASNSPGIGISKKFLHVLGNHYPERLGHALCINTPWYFYPFFRVIQPFIDPVTRAKIKFVDLSPIKPRRDDEWVDIKEYISPGQLQEEFGGQVRYTFEFESYWKHLLEKTGEPF